MTCCGRSSDSSEDGARKERARIRKAQAKALATLKRWVGTSCEKELRCIDAATRAKKGRGR